MRQSKKRGKIPALVTLNEMEICEACNMYVKSKNFKTGKSTFLRIPIKSSKEDSKGRKRRTKLEISVEIEE